MNPAFVYGKIFVCNQDYSGRGPFGTMNVEYNIVGIARGEKNEMAELCSKVGHTVFAAALFILKDKKDAKNVSVETFRRVRAFAYSFDTDMNGEYWITDMAVNISRNYLTEKKDMPEISSVDNASSLLTSALDSLSNERGLLLALRSLSELSFRDISDITGYYRDSCRKEISRGKKELSVLAGGETKPKNICAELKKDIIQCCPDFYDLIDSDYDTAVSHISHERLYLDTEQAQFNGNDEKAVVTERENVRKAEKKHRLLIACVIILSFLLVAGAVVASVMTYRRRNSEPAPTERPSVQFGNTVDFTGADGKIFYRGITGGIYSYKAGDDSPVKISDENAKELVSDGTRLYFRSTSGSKIFSMEFDGSGVTQLSNVSGTTLAVSSGYLYFSTSKGISRINVSLLPGTVSEAEDVYVAEVEDAPSRNHMGVTEDGRVFFSGGADLGLYEVTAFGEGTGLTPVYFDEAYYFQIDGDNLYYDVRLFDKIYIYCMQTSDRKMYSLPVFTYTAAYYINDGYIYYEGVMFDEEGNIREGSTGLYKMKLDSEAPEMLFEIPLDGLHMSEIYADSSNIYCYYSDGLSGGERKIAVYDLNGRNEIIFR